jgi:hypothetical protein
VTGPDVTEQDSADRAGAVPTGPLAGEPRERALELPWAHRVGSWLIWWVLMMSFWVMLDDSIATDELLAGAGAAAFAALLAELVTYQAATRFRMRIEWLVPALRLPGEVARDMVIVYAALWRRLAHGQQPDSALACGALYWRRLPLLRRGYEPGVGLTAPLRRFQSGVVNDYVTWIVLGLACVGGVLAFIVQ